MTQLINKGGFRERANRSRKYKNSENEITILPPSEYQPPNKEKDKQTQVDQNPDQRSEQDA
ncbi:MULTISPECIES: hypothetical protein [unclassified Acinetobacter]|uniref:hypothetical protein n=1 Tax=unclassified Acinetobacter TaxID=196816 RepID=UPI0002CF71F2|nr:hypothetical protein [Acinetobacter sp. NIPH 298]ENW96217.1 hypothetical protein F903_01987 [Acinetobacter sp. NIPH 298]MDR7015356.1 hypothetical protein [Prolinoborus sp. 3657]